MGGEAAARETLGRRDHAREPPMSQSFDASKSLTAFEQDSTLVAVIEMSQSKWLVAAVVPGIARHPLKKVDADAGGLRKPCAPWGGGARVRENEPGEWGGDLEGLRLVHARIPTIESERLRGFAKAPAAATGPHAMVRLIAKVLGVGIETADMLVNEVLARNLRDRRAVARYAGLTRAPDESGKRRREKGLARAGHGRVRRALIPLGLRSLIFQKESRLVRWFRARTADGRSTTRKTMIVALARKLLIALWRLVTTGEMTEGLKLRPAGPC